jgi:hypothetical protein
MLMDDIKEMFLKRNKKYLVKDIDTNKKIECYLTQQTNFLFIFTRVEETNLQSKICISKVDYYLQPRLIIEM